MTPVRCATVLLGSIFKVVTPERGNVASDRVEWTGRTVLVHSARTAVAAVASFGGPNSVRPISSCPSLRPRGTRPSTIFMLRPAF